MVKLLLKITASILVGQCIFAQPQSPSTANEAHVLILNKNAQIPQNNNPPQQVVPSPQDKINPPQTQSNNIPPPIKHNNEQAEVFKEYQRMEDLTNNPCSGSQDCALSETTVDNPINQQAVDLSDPKTRPDIEKILPRINAAGEAAQRNDDTPR